jgi:hypothetical protein
MANKSHLTNLAYRVIKVYFHSISQPFVYSTSHETKHKLTHYYLHVFNKLFLQVLTSIILTGIFAYVRVVVAMCLRVSRGADGLFWCGLATQAGSCIGAVFAFLLVSVFSLFTSESAC